MNNQDRIDIDKPLWDLNTFMGRLKYFAWMTDPRTCVVSKVKLFEAKELLEKYRENQAPRETAKEDIIYALKLYKSAFHPDTGELQLLFGRMSFQVPAGILLITAMLHFYRSTAAVIFWQFLNQSTNSIVNYTNRNGKSQNSFVQLFGSFVSATSIAVYTATRFKKLFEKLSNPFLQRYVPFTAIAAATFCNIPLMRQNEIIYGIDVEDKNGNNVGKSRLAAIKGISQVIHSRIVMSAPSMLILPAVMEKLEQNPAFKRMTFLHIPFQAIVTGLFLSVMLPFSCAIYPQRCSLNTKSMAKLERRFYGQMIKKHKGKIPAYVYFNKGL